ncbi:SDR family NAD(P)-dependent oxidoreductase [bacterium]
MRLKQKYALITGGSQGLGKTVAEEFVKQGASVILCARNEKILQQTQHELSKKLDTNQKVLIQVIDVSDISQVEKLREYVYAEFPRLDIVVNNAGIYGPKGKVEDVEYIQWKKAIDINLLGTFYICHVFLPQFKKQGYGKIINLSGGGATSPLPYLSAYAASKAAVVRFTETLALELSEHKIDVNAIAPGALNTRLLDEVLDAGPEKVGKKFYEKAKKQKQDGGVSLGVGASLCVFLASSESDGITGKLISAVWDPWKDLPKYIEDLKKTDIYTLRRIIPEQRGKNWGG